MAGESRVAEKLRAFLRELSPATRAMLVAEIERSVQRGESLPLSDFLLIELRAGATPAGAMPAGAKPDDAPVAAIPPPPSDPPAISPQTAPAPAVTPHATGADADEALRLFSAPFDRLLVADAPDSIHPGRLSRAAFAPVWTWIARDLVPEETRVFAARLSSAERNSDDARAAARLFQDVVLEHLDGVLATLKTDDRARRRLGAQIGTRRALDDVQQVATFLRGRDTLASLTQRIAALRGPGDDKLDAMVALLQSVHTRHPDIFPSGLALAMLSAQTFWQPVRIAIRAAQSDSVQRIAETPFTVAVSIVLAELDRLVRLLAADLKSGELKSAAGRLKDIHDAVRGLRAELDLSSGAGWAREIAARRAQIGDCLKGDIESVPGRVRRLLRPTPGLATGTLDAAEVAAAERSISFLNACRAYASELALNEMTMRVFSELQHYLETTTEQLVDSLRTAGPARRHRQSQVDAAVRFCAKVFGQDYAQLLARAADLAMQDERRQDERRLAERA